MKGWLQTVARHRAQKEVSDIPVVFGRWEIQTTDLTGSMLFAAQCVSIFGVQMYGFKTYA
jgi:hypothetical protein